MTYQWKKNIIVYVHTKKRGQGGPTNVKTNFQNSFKLPRAQKNHPGQMSATHYDMYCSLTIEPVANMGLEKSHTWLVLVGNLNLR